MKFGAMVAVALAAACASPTASPVDPPAAGPDGRIRTVGSIKGYNQDDPRVSVVASGREVTVSVTTYGGGCHGKADTVVRVSGLTADVTPYDYAPPPDMVCTQPLISTVHQATIRFESAGTALIRIHGRDASANNWNGRMIVVERTVTVQ